MNIRKKDIFVSGAALFAIFFGAGNLIFPPHIGVLAGDKWWEVVLGFLAADPVLPILALIVCAYLGGDPDDIGRRVGDKFSKILGTIIILILAAFFAVPRTGSVTHEIFVVPNFGGIPLPVTATIFFAITLIIVLNPTKVVDIIGKYLTPILLIILALIIILTIVSPVDPLVKTGAEGLFKMGFYEGYQTMDAIGGALMLSIVVADLKRKGYTDDKVRFKAIIGVGIVAGVLLILVYGGLTYAGARVGGHFNADTERTALLIGMVELLLGSAGKIVLGVAVAFACLTTSSGLISVCGNYFDKISGGKLAYKPVVIATTICAWAISMLGTDQIIKVAVPVLLTVYPVFMILVFMGIFNKKLKYNLTFTGGVIGAFVVSVIEAINVAGAMFTDGKANLLGGAAGFIRSLPLAGIGFEWLLPAICTAIIFTIIAAVGKVGGTLEDVKAKK